MTLFRSKKWASHGTVDGLGAQPGQFVTLRRAQRISLHRTMAALLALGLRDPIADRLAARFEFTRQIFWFTSGAEQLDHLAPEFRRIRGRFRGINTPHVKALQASTVPGEAQTAAASVSRVPLTRIARPPAASVRCGVPTWAMVLQAQAALALR